jgi:putative tryptophan/tyrosine transport system substrate-binding protein
MQFAQLKRRELITLLGGVATAWPLAARAQQTGRIYRIGFLANDPTIPAQPAWRAFLEGLRENGFIEGKNIIIERRFAEGAIDRYADLVAELVRLEVDVIVTSFNDATLAAKRATTKIPVVMMSVNDPVAAGIVASLAHPGGNITGAVQDETAEIAAKRLQMAKDAVPQVSRVAALINPDEVYAQAELRALETAAQSLRLTLQPVAVHRVDEFDGAFDRVIREHSDAVIVSSSSLIFTHRRLVAERAARSRLPVVSTWREFTEVGGLMSYGSVRIERFRHAAIFVAKILKGAKPADLPIEQPTKYELIINLKTARSLNLDIPRDLLLVADEVIE